jgi:TatA/E family protein of Tat protein translocase
VDGDAQEALAMFGHMTEVLGLLVLGLIIFGPKRMIELGGQLGRTLRELQSAMKDMSWNPLGDDSSSANPSRTTLGKLSQMAQNFTAEKDTPESATEPTHVVETTAQPTSETPPTSAS